MISVVLPYLSTSECIDTCKKYLLENTTNVCEIVEIIDSTDVYDAFNSGVHAASYDIVVLINDDMFMGPGWDELYAKYTTPKSVVTGHLIESGRLPVNFRNIEYDCGRTPQDYDYQKFLDYVESHPVPEVIEGGMGWYMPVAFHKSTYVDYPNDIKYPHPNDITLISHMLPAMGYSFRQVGSYAYHLQNFSNKDLK